MLRSEVEAAGFTLVAEGNFWRNASDPRDFSTQQPTGPVDNFVLKFQKPQLRADPPRSFRSTVSRDAPRQRVTPNATGFGWSERRDLKSGPQFRTLLVRRWSPQQYQRDLRPDWPAARRWEGYGNDKTVSRPACAHHGPRREAGGVVWRRSSPPMCWPGRACGAAPFDRGPGPSRSGARAYPAGGKMATSTR